MKQEPEVCSVCAASFEWPDDGVKVTMENNAWWRLQRHMDGEHASVGFVCPRAAEAPINGDLRAYWSGHGECSYCGSFSEENFFAAIEAGAEIGPTDKSYKAYLNGEGTPPHTGAAKFYFQHLSKDGRGRFIALMNERPRRIKIGYPGHFYVLPFFITATVDP